MTINLKSAQSKIIIAALLCVSTLAYCAPYDYWGLRKIDFELTGQALDFDTKQPLEGVYVLAIYEKVDLGMAASARFCIKTKGMMTGKDGKFHFPVDKLDGNSPSKLAAIKPDYYFRNEKDIPTAIWRKQNKETYANRDVYLKKQDPAKLELKYGYYFCERPLSSEASAANVEFLKIRRAEIERLAIASDWKKKVLNDHDELIRDMQSNK